MMHWKATLLVLAVFLATQVLVGCSQPCCLPDYDEVTKRAGLPQDLNTNPDLINHPVADFDNVIPRTVDDSEREPRYITLWECIAMALEKGTVGSQSLRTIFNSISILNTGTVFFGNSDDMVSFNGAQAVGSDAIRVFALQPAITQTDIEASLARYDVVARTFLGFNTVDMNPSATQVQQPNGQFAQFGVSAEKALPTGGVTDITFGNTPPGVLSDGDFNTSRATNFYSRYGASTGFGGASGYTPDLRVGFSQPLLKFFGTDVNSLLTSHPLSPSQQLAGSSAATAPPIVIARINFNQSRAEFERLVNYMVLNVETAYWQLYALYVNLYSTEQAMKQSRAVWYISKQRFEAGKDVITQYAQTRSQYEDFRAQRLQALSKVLEQERILRVLCGMQPEDCTKLVPVDTPTVAPFRPDWCSAWQEALHLRPELVIAREDVKRRQLELIREKNNMLPDVRVEGGYAIHAFGTRLDGDGVLPDNDSSNAFRSMAGGHFGDYNLGIVGSVPLGYRAQSATLRAANLRVAQSFLVLRDQERKAWSNLEVAYRQVYADYHVIEMRRAQREASALQLEARFQEYLAGKTTVDFLLTAQQQWAAALSQEFQAITNYNFDLAAFQFCKGTLLAHNGIAIAEGPLPQCIQVRAVENERQRAQAIVCLEHAAPVVPNNGCCVPAIPSASTPSLPSLGMDQMRPAQEKLEDMAPLPLSGGQPMTPPAQTSSSPAAPAELPIGPAASAAPSMTLPPLPPPAAAQMAPVAPNLPLPPPPSPSSAPVMPGAPPAGPTLPTTPGTLPTPASGPIFPQLPLAEILHQ